VTGAEDDLVGKTLGGRYRVARLLGRGGMGSVYEAVDVDLGRRVALKVMLPELTRDPVLLERFRREVRNTALLTHPNVVQVTDYGRLGNEPPFLVMELLEGRTLVARLKKGRLEPRRAVRIALQVLSALAAAHDAGVVHRDLKPENVFLVGLEGGVELVKLLDFGLAKLMDDEAFARLTRTGVLVGTPRYAAPEQVKGSRGVDGRTDVYAAGVLLYAMLTGRPPFLAQPPQLWNDLLQKEPTDPRIVVPTLPPDLVEIVRKAMSKRPQDRYPSARAMTEALTAYLAGSRGSRSLAPPEAPSVSLAPPPPAPARSSLLVPILVGFAMVVAVGAVLAGVTLAWAMYAGDELEPDPVPAPMPIATPLPTPTPTMPPVTSPVPDVPPTRPTLPSQRPTEPTPGLGVPPSVAPAQDTCAAYERRACDCPIDPQRCGQARTNIQTWRRDPEWMQRACATALADAERACAARTIEPWPPPNRPSRGTIEF
jgi:serine/threonine-protein kinase